jgi:hypothetical protein
MSVVLTLLGGSAIVTVGPGEAQEPTAGLDGVDLTGSPTALRAVRWAMVNRRGDKDQ